MSFVWRELTKRNRDDSDRDVDGALKTFKHQFVPPWLWDGDSWLPRDAGEVQRDQQLAIQAFFERLVNTAIQTGPIIFREPGAFDRGRHRDEATSLRSDTEMLRNRAAELGRLISPGESPEALRRYEQLMLLVRAITVIDSLADETDRAKHEEGTLRAFVVLVGAIAKSMFGTALVTTTATIASVAFGREIKGHTVREIFRSLSLASPKA